jgi:hypothetical protein
MFATECGSLTSSLLFG